MSKYSVEITGINTNNLTVLSNEEMTKLFNDLRNGDKSAKEKLVTGNLKLVLSILRKINNNKYNLDDLFQIGVVGLVKAVDNFDLSFNCLFSTYAVPLISGEIKRYIRDFTSIRISRGIKDNAYQILKYKDEYEKKYGIEPTNEEISNSLDMSDYDIKLALDSLREPMSIYDPIYSDQGDTIYLCDQIADNKNKNDEKDDLIALRKALEHIKQRERKVLEDRYIIGKTQTEIAENLKISQAQVSRIEKNAIVSLKRLLK
ncbi:MAG: sigma-70 family RNA polymerase sigma factor [Bacilli bacterium]|nr:sigma-70 family RNA polymerase sigma factor [Bacilli bacterium]